MGEFISPLPGDQADLFGMLFNVLIMAAVGGLWLMWARSIKRQKNVEDILAATSGQLEEATRHLEHALHEIKRLQEQQEADDDSARATQPGTRRAANQPAPAETASPDKVSTGRPGDAEDSVQATAQPVSSHPAHAYRRAGSAATSRPSTAPDSERAAADSAAAPEQSDVQRIIRLHGAGVSAGKIATQLDIPLARVSLLLRLHQQQAPQAGGQDNR